MFRLNGYSMRLVLVGIVAVMVLCSGSAKADFTFGEPVNLGSTVNSVAFDGVPCISADGLELYFSSYRDGGYGEADIWVCNRETTEDEWGPAMNLGPVLNSPHADWQAAISTDGLELYFQVWEPDASGSIYISGEIWVTRRIAKGEPWGQPEKLNLTVPGGDLLGGPSLTADGLELYFFAAWFGDEPRTELYVTKRAAVEDPWGEPVRLDSFLNEGACQADPRISSDGLLLISTDWWACSPQVGGITITDIWIIQRATRDGAWLAPMNPGPPVNSPYRERGGMITIDGSTFYFTSDRPGGSGSVDLWQAPVLPVVDFDDDGNVGTDDLLLMIESWGTDDQMCDIGPMPWGDDIVDEADLEILMDHWGQSHPVYIVVDDFESYNDNADTGTTIFHTWLDGMGYGEPAPGYDGNGTGSTVGHASGPPFAEQTIVHGGYQSMPLWYDNDGAIYEGTEWELKGLPFYSEAQRHWETPQDWTVKGVEVLTLWFHGDADNATGRQIPEPLYVALKDEAGNSASIVHPDPSAITIESWEQWRIALVDFTDVDPATIKMMAIGVGDPASTNPRGSGVVYIDDIELHRSSGQ